MIMNRTIIYLKVKEQMLILYKLILLYIKNKQTQKTGQPDYGLKKTLI
jgi:hypothetical protein